MSNRFIAPILLLLAVATLHAAAIRNRQVHEVDLRNLQRNPNAYQGLNVRFRCTFVQTASLYAPFHTPFTPERFMNIVVWDDEAALWRPEVRADPMTTLYYEKEQLGTALIGQLGKYDVIDITGEVVASYRGRPWIDIRQVELVERQTVYDDTVIHLLQEASELNQEMVYDLADQNYAAALDEPLPPGGRIAITYLRARNNYQAGDFEAAVAQLDDGLAAYRSWDGEKLPVSKGELHFLMARSEQGLAERAGAGGAAVDPHYERAVEHARAAIAEHPELGDGHAVLGIALAGLERYDDARLRCQRAVRMLPDNAEVRWYLGRIYDQQGRYDEAIDTLKRAIDLAPKDYRIHKSIAASYFRRGTTTTPRNHDDVVMALREYDIAIKLEPNDADLFYHSGMVIKYATEQGIELRIGSKTVVASRELAVRRWISCLAVDDSYLPAHLELAHYYRSQEQHDDALSHYQRAIELAPTDYDLQRMLGDYYWEEERRQEAYAVFEELQKVMPDDERILYALQRLSHEMGAYEQGVAWGDLLLRHHSDNMAGRANQTELLLWADDPRQAVRMADTLLGEDDDAERVLRTTVAKALAWWAQDRPGDVVETVGDTPIADLGPELRLVYGWSLTGLDEEERPEGLLAVAQAVVADDPENPSAQELLAWSLYLAGAPAAAEKTLLPLADTIDEHVYAYRMGMILFAQGPERYPEAKTLLDLARDELRSDLEILRDARNQAGRAQSDIRRHEREVERQQRADQREAERKAREEARARERAEREAKKQAEEEARAKAKAEEEAREQAEREAREKAKAAERARREAERNQ